VPPTGLTSSGRASQRPKINELGRDPIGAREARASNAVEMKEESNLGSERLGFETKSNAIF